MSAATVVDVIGTPLDRVDGRLKVTGAATYPIDVTLPGVAYAGSGGAARCRADESSTSRSRPPSAHLACWPSSRTSIRARLAHAPATGRMGDPIGPQPLPPFQSDAVLHYGQHVAMVVAETREEANAAAALVEVTYQRDAPVLAYEDLRASRVSHPWTPDYVRGDVPSALAAADVRIDETYTTSANTNNPIGLFATVAAWDGDVLTVHDTTQHPHGVRDTLATAFGIAPASVRVLVPFVGGAFGAGLRAWPHVDARRRCRADHEAACEAGADAGPNVHGGRPSATDDPAGVHRGERRRTAHRHRPCLDLVDRHGRRVGQSDHLRDRPCVRVPQCVDSRHPGAPEHPYTWLDACTRRSRRLVRPGVGHRRALVRLGPRSHRAAGQESRPRAPRLGLAVVEQCATRLLSTGRRALRLVGPDSGAPLDVARRATRGIRHGTRGVVRVSAPLQGHRNDPAGRHGRRPQRRDRYRTGPLHRDDDDRGRLSWRAAQARAARPR